MAGTNDTIPVITQREQLTTLLRFLEQDSIHFGSNQKKTTKKEAVEDETDNVNVTIISHPKQPAFDFKSWNVNRNSSNQGYGKTCSFIGGTPITLQTAMDLRNIVNGSCIHSLSSDWKTSALTFHYSDSIYPYGLQTNLCGSRDVILCIQAYIIKDLVFTGNRPQSDCNSLLCPSEIERKKVLIEVMGDILWKLGEGSCCICLYQDNVCFNKDYRYREDKVTEKIHIFEFYSILEVKLFIKRHLGQFQKPNRCGCLLFLYSAILSRTVSRIKRDIGVSEDKQVKLLTDKEECTPSLINMLITGRAVPCLHNGDILYDKHGSLLHSPLFGIKERSIIGVLHWHEKEEKTEVGSMLKTPKYPIWLTMVNGHMGLLFSTNIDLINDWRSEHRFTLYYYTGLDSLRKQTVLSIDTVTGYISRPKTSRLLRKEEDNKLPPLDQCISTKWYGASINWNGTRPYI